MPSHVLVNKLGLTYKGTIGLSVATLPDVCKTPSPGGPVPIPYPNFADQGSLKKGTKTVKAKGKMIAIKGSEYSTSTGDEPGTAGGVKSSTFKKETSWITYSFDVKMDGKNACRNTDKKFHNHKNTVDLAGNLDPVPPASNIDRCAEAREAAEEEAEIMRDVTPKGDRPQTVSGLQASNGQTVAGHSGGGNNGVVEDLARSFPENANNCGCAELNTISNAMDQGIDVTGAVIITIEIRGRASPTGKHGTPKAACSVCAEVFEELEITEC